MNKKLLASLGLALLLFGVAGCSDPSEGDGAAGTSEEQGTQEADLEGVPDVVAEVNGVEIPKDVFASLYEGQFQQMQMQAQGTGQELDQEALRQQVAEAMVDTELLVQEADRRDLEVTEEALDSAMTDLMNSSQMASTEELLAAFEEQGMDEDEVRSQLETQVRLDQLVVDEVGDAEPAEEELRELYDQSVAQQESAGEAGTELPPFEEARPQLVEMAANAQASEAYEGLVTELREAGDVTIHL